MLHREDAGKAHEKWPKMGVFQGPHRGANCGMGMVVIELSDALPGRSEKRDDICKRVFLLRKKVGNVIESPDNLLC